MMDLRRWLYSRLRLPRSTARTEREEQQAEVVTPSSAAAASPLRTRGSGEDDGESLDSPRTHLLLRRRHGRRQREAAVVSAGLLGAVGFALSCFSVQERIAFGRNASPTAADSSTAGTDEEEDEEEERVADEPPCFRDEGLAVCTAVVWETCYRDDAVCALGAGGLGCSAGGHRSCRFCGFGAFAGVPCPGQPGFGEGSPPPPPTPPPPGPPAAPPPPPPPLVTPPPPGGTRERLVIVNGCTEDPLYIANFAGAATHFEQDIRLAAGERRAFAIPNRGLASTRFWPKWGCDDAGQNCQIGQSGGPGESCPARGCAPPVDSKFEATFGCFPEVAKRRECARNPSDPSRFLDGSDWWDVSQVDGWTLPYKVEVSGKCDSAPSVIDCSTLSLNSCPAAEHLGPTHGTQDLRLLEPEEEGGSSRSVVGCYSPCGKLTYSNWDQGFGLNVASEEARDYCCPTPPISPAQCSAGPVARTKFVEAVHRLCPGVYAYAYDDGQGLSRCDVGPVYTVTFYCPAWA